jgi:hypothetical protein
VTGHADGVVRAWRYLRDVYATMHTGLEGRDGYLP